MPTVKREARTTHRATFIANIEMIEKHLSQGYSGSDTWRILCDTAGCDMSYQQFMRYVQKYGLLNKDGKFIPNNWVKSQTYIHL